MIKIFDNYYSKHLEKFAVCFVAFLLSFALIKTAMNHLPDLRSTFALISVTGLVLLIIYVSKPIRGFLALAFVGLHGFLLLSLLKGGSLVMQTTFYGSFPFLRSLEKVHTALGIEGFYGQMIDKVFSNINERGAVIDQVYFDFFCLSLIIFIGLLVSYLVEKRVNWIVFALPGLYFFVGWFLYVSQLNINFAYYLIAVIVYQQFLNYENLSLDNIKGHHDYTQAFFVNIVTLVGVLSLATLMVWMMPLDKINSKISGLTPSIAGLRDEFPAYKASRTFSFSTTMYAPYGKTLGGPIKERTYENVMYVKGDEGGLYLRGRVHNVYDGSRWSSDYNSYTIMSSQDASQPLDQDKVTSVKIYPENIKTRTLFSPYSLVKSSFKDKEVYQNGQKIAFLSNDVKAEFEPYTVYYSSERLEILHEKDRNAYLGIPEEGLPVTRGLAERLTQESTSDRDKMETLVSHLRTHYHYSLEPEFYQGPIDFVEKFIAEDKVGYCTYFATSLAVMGRSVGVPTRYVEGYLTGYYKDQDGFYPVSDNRAHAWVEAYIEGEGWQVFEATPAYNPPGEATFLETPASTAPDRLTAPGGLERIEEPSEDFNLNTNLALPLDKPETVTEDKGKGFKATWLILGLALLGLLGFVVQRRKNKTARQKIFKMIYRMDKVAKKYKIQAQNMWPKAAIAIFMDQDLAMDLTDDEAMVIDSILYGPPKDYDHDLWLMNDLYKRYLKKCLKNKGIFLYIRLKL